ncbi:DHA2 family efflux MFS transporter permease subunit [Paraconexibacter antarcticus]|uniref:DHA2 family efflux MFS transporter permease subunit n=1 Tax=Paraconexibacter antarcticus TaxID=2949664 RepID=UPI0026667C2E|nr:DHA2 family efflux MFS transporter permease subunit [Paraconexibacter antarcticus]
MALGVVCLGQLMMVLDATIVNVALPAIQSDLRFSNSSLTWIPNAYLIAYGSFLLLGGRVGDLIGRTKMFLAGLVVFTLGSVACGLAGSAAVLIVARFGQGVGSAIAASAILALIVIEFPDPRERARAMGVYTFVSVAGGSTGLLLGGLLTQSFSWHWIFFINVPIGIAGLILGWRVLERDRGLGMGEGVDVLGSVLITVASMSGIFAIVNSEAHGAGSPGTLATAGVALVLLVAFSRLESRLDNPILPPRIMRQRTLVVSCLVRSMLVVGMYSSFFLGSLYFERVRGYGPVATGAAFLPQTLVVAALSLGLTNRLVRRIGVLPVLVGGMATLTVSLAVLGLTTGAQTPYAPAMLLAYMALGVGAGTSFLTLITVALADVAPEDAGIASGMVNVSVQIGGAIGLALLGTIAAARTKALSHHGVAEHIALAHGYRLAFLLGAGAVAIGLGLALRFLWSPARRAAAAAAATA